MEPIYTLCEQSVVFLGTFAQSQKVPISFITSVSHQADSCQIRYWRLLLKSAEKTHTVRG
jgi:hypothetical protein